MDEQTYIRMLQQVLDLWITPEIKKRKSLSRLPDNFNLKAAQIVFSLDRGWAKIRLNKEVKAIIEGRAKTSIKKDEIVQEDQIEVENIKLTDDDKNCAHVTLLEFRGIWIIAFDFRYNKGRIQEHIEAAKEFYESAEINLKSGRLHPFFEDAFAAAELSSKAILLNLPDKKILHGTRHNERIDRFISWAKLGNVPLKHSEILYDLYHKWRPSARYLVNTEYKKANAKEILETIKEMIKFAQKEIQ